MNKIDIQIKENKEFGDVAFLVDKPAFLKAVERLRKKWGLEQLILPDKFKEWKDELFYKRDSKRREQDILKKQPVDHLSDADLEVFKEHVERVMPDVDFECDIRDLRIEFNKPETFDKAIAYAIVCGIIPDGIYKSTYWANDLSIPAPIRLQDRTSRIAIYVTPQSQQKDVLEAFKQVREGVFKSRGDSYYPFFSLYDKDEITNIKRDRDLYWRKLQGSSYKVIALEDNKNRLKDPYWIEDYKEIVRKAIKRYQKVLTAT